MKVLKILGIIIASIVVLLVILYFASPKEAHMERTAFIEAPPARVYRVVNNYHEFNTWNPFYELDPDTRVSYEGPERGVGAKYIWKSDTLGNGSMWIVESEPDKLVKSRMKFEGYGGEPFATVKLEPKDDGTQVTWIYDEQSEGMYRLGNLVGMVDKMLGPNFERGLEKLKEHIEGMPDDSSPDITVEEAAAISYIGVTTSMQTAEMENISQTMGNNFGKIMSYLNGKNLKMKGAPMSLYPEMTDEQLTMINAIPVDGEISSDDPDIQYGTTGGGSVVKAVHRGDYRLLPATYAEVTQYIADHDLQQTGAPYEVYVTDPGVVRDTSEWVTEVYFPVGE